MIQSAGAFQDATLAFCPVEESVDIDECGDGGVTAGDGAGGKGFLCVGGLGGTVLMKDLKERTGFSIPSSEDDEELACLNGDRIWLRLYCMPRGVASGSCRRKYQYISTLRLLEGF